MRKPHVVSYVKPLKPGKPNLGRWRQALASRACDKGGVRFKPHRPLGHNILSRVRSKNRHPPEIKPQTEDATNMNTVTSTKKVASNVTPI